MRKLTLIFLLLTIASFSNAQRIYVEKTDDGYEQPILDKLLSSNYHITFKRDSADYVIEFIISKSGMWRAKGSILLINNKSGDLIAKSKEANGQTTAFNGYGNPKMLTMKKIANDYLLDLLKKINSN